MAEENFSLQVATEKAATEAHQQVNPQHLEFAPNTLAPVQTIDAATNPLLNPANAATGPVTNQVPLPPTATPPLPTGGGASNPLDQLKDIHLPEPVTFFPSAPGWWLLGIIILSIISYLIYRHYRYKKLIRLITPATQEIKQLTQADPSASSLAQLSALLKRISLVYFPKAQVASLQAEPWFEFLNNQSQQHSKQLVTFDNGHKRLLTQAAYERDPKINLDEWKNLLHLSQQWIENVITQQAKKTAKWKCKIMMIFLYPWLFLALPLPFIIWFFNKPSEAQLTSIRTPLFANWKRLSAQTQHSSRHQFWRKLLNFIIWALLLTAVARPQWIDEPIEIPTSGRDLLLSIDISGSMSEEDLKLQGRPVNRLAVVKSVVSEFIKKREGDRIGLVLFW
ncbi:MAG: DUF4381 family protein [Enterobacterales bacterium]|nr:DUF4381 family protein [Enterobacterales bacterium]